MMIIFWIIAVVMWKSTGEIFLLYNFVYIGTALGIGFGIYELLPKKKKPLGRRLAQFLVGAYLLVFLGFFMRENMQIEGFFFYVLSGFFAGSTIHYLVAKVAGPIIFGRGFCGWACWITMILDLLPYKRNKQNRVSEKWEYLRYGHFILSLGLVLVFWFGFNQRLIGQDMADLYWLIGGNLLYYAIGIVLAYKLQDNRAFCKYICPVPVIQKLTSRFSLLKIAGDPQKCNNCGACSKMCPMDIQVSKYTLQNQRVLSTECILCFECIDVCAKKALRTSFRFDFGNQELLNRRENHRVEEAANKRIHNT